MSIDLRLTVLYFCADAIKAVCQEFLSSQI